MTNIGQMWPNMINMFYNVGTGGYSMVTGFLIAINSWLKLVTCILYKCFQQHLET